jgi:hypothetical protein
MEVIDGWFEYSQKAEKMEIFSLIPFYFYLLDISLKAVPADYFDLPKGILI